MAMRWRISLVLGTFLLLGWILLGYLGGISFLGRVLNDKWFCQVIKNCNPITTIFTDRPLANFDDSASDGGLRLTQVVFLGKWGENIFVWSPYGLIKNFRVNKNTTLGVSLIYDDNDKNNPKVKKLITAGALKSISVDLLGRDEASTSATTGKKLAFGEIKDVNQFMSLVKPGNFLKIIYQLGFLAQDIIIVDL